MSSFSNKVKKGLQRSDKLEKVDCSKLTHFGQEPMAVSVNDLSSTQRKRSKTSDTNTDQSLFDELSEVFDELFYGGKVADSTTSKSRNRGIQGWFKQKKNKLVNNFAF